MKLTPVLVAVLAAGALLAGRAAFQRTAADAPQAKTGAAQAGDGRRSRLTAEPVDRWNPARDVPVTPAYGGTLHIHIESLPSTLDGALTNLQNARNVLQEIHATLVRRDWETAEILPDLAE